MNLFKRFEAFLFSPLSTTGFGLMRSAWAATALAFFLMQMGNVQFFYGPEGLIPSSLEHLITRNFDRFTLLDVFPNTAVPLYALLIVSLVCSMLGVLPRLSTILSFVLMASFHERNPLILGGGDTVLRLVGFLLCIAPRIDAFSLSKVRRQWNHWKTKRTLLPQETMSIWPYRLLLWQVIVIYATSTWYKLLGTMWWDGTAVSATLQQELFARWDRSVMSLFLPMSPLVTWFTLAFEAAWILLLYPRSATRWMFAWEPQPAFKRLLIILGILFHGGIFVLMDVGSFSLAMMVAYCGLLTGEDVAAIKRWMNKQFTNPKSLISNPSIIVLYDGHCGLCLRSIFGLQILDAFKRLQYVNFRDTKEKNAVAPDLSEKELDKAMHILTPEPYRGFDGFRLLAWYLPALWPVAPFLYIPGIPWIGRKVYAHIAQSRKRCDHENCAI